MKVTNAREFLKILLMKENMSVSKLAEKLTQLKGEHVYQQTLSQKLIKGTLKFNEMLDICDILGYEIEFKKI
ncbi:MAG: DUF6471 domain-containing protein [Candidatus Gastranaerophilaceae bacterium]